MSDSEGQPRPRASVERQHAYAMVEEAYALRRGDAALFGAVEAAMRAAYDEGVKGTEYVPCYKEPKAGEERAAMSMSMPTGGYRVLEAKGFWSSAPGMQLPEPWIVMRPGGSGITDAMAICLSKEDADVIAQALAHAGE